MRKTHAKLSILWDDFTLFARHSDATRTNSLKSYHIYRGTEYKTDDKRR